MTNPLAGRLAARQEEAAGREPHGVRERRVERPGTSGPLPAGSTAARCPWSGCTT
ncbi:hypothetical protein ABTY20_22105 [Streptomyces sp. NPDC126497]|uniref:hypothetical protein n=1 Tax=Streptomyces sp. NPDC126497 TaxID=3155313 RepID=UPI003333FAFD